jgi:small subunit ribosomal protein S8
MVIDPISDLITRIRNTSLTTKNEVLVPYSTIKEGILKILTHEQYVLGFDVTEDESKKKVCIIHLDPNTKKTFTYKRVSKPGQRMYLKAKNLKPVYNGLGISIISTPKGLMTNKQAFKEKLGGEILLEVW